jgi:glycerol kinase
VLAVDQGTSGTKAIVFDAEKNPLAQGYSPLRSYFPRPGFVEQKPDEILDSARGAVAECLRNFAASGIDGSIEAVGISNQRETFLLWDESGRPLCDAVVWQCKRSIDICEGLKPREGLIRRRTGLIADPYFSGTKVEWLAGNSPEIQEAIRARRARFGTVDTWLLSWLTGEYATDHTNASRTMFMNLDSCLWDGDMLDMLGLSGLVLPELRPSTALFGHTDFDGLFPRMVPVNAAAGDSQAAAFGEGCVRAGVAKATLGTGSSIIMNTGGAEPECGDMVRTVCYSHGSEVYYGLEGIIVSCGSPVQWLRDELGLFKHSGDTEAMARSVPDPGGVYLLPAFSGVGAPFWNMSARGQIVGLTFGSTREHIVRAALESAAYQIKAVIDSMEEESGIRLSELRVDGGMASNGLVLEMIATLLDRPVTALGAGNASALGAALLAGLGRGDYASAAEIESIPAGGTRVEPASAIAGIKERYAEWTEYMKKI